jgi:hypothetical protein
MSPGGLSFRRSTRIYFSRVSVIWRYYVAKTIILLPYWVMQEPVGWPGACWYTNSSELWGNDDRWTKEVVNSNSVIHLSIFLQTRDVKHIKCKQLHVLYEKFRIFKDVFVTIMSPRRTLVPMSQLAPKVEEQYSFWAPKQDEQTWFAEQAES